MASDKTRSTSPPSGTCVACGGLLAFFGPRDGYEYHICRRCGTLQLYPMPDEKELASAYEEQFCDSPHIHELRHPEHWRKASRPYHRSIADTLTDRGISGTIIDFGAGWGHLCELLLDRGFECWGFEPSTKMAQHCRERQLPVYHGDFRLAEDSSKPASAVVMCSVFEHLVNHSAWLTRIRSVLRPGGYLITLHPTAACYVLLGRLLRLNDSSKPLPELHSSFNPPWHTALFSLRAMGILAADNGFELLEIRRAPQGRAGGAVGAVQFGLDLTNRLGWALFRTHWPLVTTHIFVMRKTGDLEEELASRA